MSTPSNSSRRASHRTSFAEQGLIGRGGYGVACHPRPSGAAVHHDDRAARRMIARERIRRPETVDGHPPTLAIVPTPKRIAPIFPVADVGAALDFYQRLGFPRGPTSGAATASPRWTVSRPPGGVAEVRSPSAAYLFVDDAAELATAWASAGIDVHPPQDTEWGMHEGVVVDPDGNVLRFGSPRPEPRAVAHGRALHLVRHGGRRRVGEPLGIMDRAVPTESERHLPLPGRYR